MCGPVLTGSMTFIEPKSERSCSGATRAEPVKGIEAQPSLDGVEPECRQAVERRPQTALKRSQEGRPEKREDGHRAGVRRGARVWKDCISWRKDERVTS